LGGLRPTALCLCYRLDPDELPCTMGRPGALLSDDRLRLCRCRGAHNKKDSVSVRNSPECSQHGGRDPGCRIRRNSGSSFCPTNSIDLGQDCSRLVVRRSRKQSSQFPSSTDTFPRAGVDPLVREQIRSSFAALKTNPPKCDRIFCSSFPWPAK